MKRLFLLVFLFAGVCFGQYVRFDAPFPSVSSTYSPLLQANLPPNSPVLAVCHSPANAVPCTNYISTFTYSGAACPSGAQDTPQPATTSACQLTGDAQGNIGFWAPAGQYDYTVCIGTTCLGPYTVTLNNSSGAAGVITVNSGSALAYPINFQNAGSINFAQSGSTINATLNSLITAGTCTLCNLTFNAFGQTTAASSGSAYQTVEANGTAQTQEPKLNLISGSNATVSCVDNSGASRTDCTVASTGSGGGNPQLENCTPDETGNSFYSATLLTNYFNASWEFVFNTTTYFNCQVYIPIAQSGATVAVDVWSSDSTAGHTASITYADGVINSGTMNIGSLTSASPQTFTTTSTANNRVTLTFNVQSTLANGSILVVKIGTTPTGTAPTANLNIYPHFIL